MQPNRYKISLLAVAILFAVSSAAAFQVDVPGQEPIHEDITSIALRRISVPVSRGQRLGFSQEAIEQIATANRQTDTSVSSQLTAENHFDDEALARGSRRLLPDNPLGVDTVIAFAAAGHGDTARRLLGGLLHTLQDFYAHSNFTETNPGQRLASFLGRSPLEDPPLSLPFCPLNASILDETVTGITTSYFRLSQKLVGLCGSVPPGKCAHGGLNPCPGINKDTSDREFHASARARATAHTEDYVNSLIDRIKQRPDAQRTILSLLGQPQGASDAPLGTLGFLVDVTGSMANDLEEVKARVRRIIFNTSASEYLLTPFSDPERGPTATSNRKSDIIQELEALQAPPRQGGDCPEMYYSGLIEALGYAQERSYIVTFTDDNAPAIGNAKDRHLIEAAKALNKKKRGIVNHITLNLDCADVERSRDLGQEASGGSGEGQAPLEENDGSARQLMQRRASISLLEYADETGGLLFDLSNSGIPTRAIRGRAIEEVVASLLSRNSDTLLRRRTERGFEKIFDIEMKTDSLVVYATGIHPSNLRLHRPSGSLVRAGDRGVIVRVIWDIFSSPGRALPVSVMMKIDKPRPGAWRLSAIRGRDFGPAIVAVLAESPVRFFDLQLLEESPIPAGPAHQSYAPIPGEPIVGRRAVGRATLLGVSTAEFRLIDEQGADLRAIELVRGRTVSTRNRFMGSFTIPDVPFRVAVRGRAASGQLYERVFPMLFRPQWLEVAVDPAYDNQVVPIGARTTLSFTVRNLGGPDTFRTHAVATGGGFVASDDGEFPILDLEETASGSFQASVMVPGDVADGTEVDLVATAVSLSDARIGNSATLRLTASKSANVMPIADAGEDQAASPGDTVRLDGSGSTDPDSGPTPLGFDWVQIAGPDTVLTGETTASPSFVPSGEGDYTFALAVNDGRATSVTDEVTISVQPDD